MFRISQRWISRRIVPLLFFNQRLYFSSNNSVINTSVLTRPKTKELGCIRINIHLDGIKNTKDLLKAQEEYQSGFNLINISTFFKKLSKLSWKTEKEKQNLKESINSLSKHFNRLLKSDFAKEENFRPLANSLFYLTRTMAASFSDADETELLELKYVDKIIKKLVDLLAANIEKLNSQEAANVVYSFSKLKHRDALLNVAEPLIARLPGFELKSIITIFYSYISLDVKPYNLLLVIHGYLKDSQDIGKLTSELDLPHIVYCYSKCEVLVTDYPKEVDLLFGKLEENKLQAIGNINSVGLSAIFSSLINFKKLMFSIETIELLEAKAVQLIPKMEPRALANIIRGFSHWGLGSNNLYHKAEENIKINFEQLDETSFYTLYYCFAKNSKGSLAFYEKYHKEIKRRMKEVSISDFNYILYGIGKLHSSEGTTNKIDEDLIKKVNEYILLNVSQFHPSQIRTVCRFFKFLFEKSKNDAEEVCLKIKEKFLRESTEQWDGPCILNVLLLFLNKRPEILENNDELGVYEKFLRETSSNTSKFSDNDSESKCSELSSLCLQSISNLKASEKRNALEAALIEIARNKLEKN